MTSAPSARTSSGWSDFTVPFVPTGMNAGVADVAVRRGENAGAGRAVGRVDGESSASYARVVTIAPRARGHPAPPPAMSVSPKRSRMGHEMRAESATIVARHSHAHSTTIASPNE